MRAQQPGQPVDRGRVVRDRLRRPERCPVGWQPLHQHQAVGDGPVGDGVVDGEPGAGTAGDVPAVGERLDRPQLGDSGRGHRPEPGRERPGGIGVREGLAQRDRAGVVRRRELVGRHVGDRGGDRGQVVGRAPEGDRERALPDGEVTRDARRRPSRRRVTVAPSRRAPGWQGGRSRPTARR